MGRSATSRRKPRTCWPPRPAAASRSSKTGRRPLADRMRRRGAWSRESAGIPPGARRAGGRNGGRTDGLGEHVSDLFNAFDFAIVAAAAANAEDLVPLAREVDAVVVIVTAGSTRRDEARALADALRSGRANVLGAVLVGEGKRAR